MVSTAELLDAKAQALGRYGRHIATAMGGEICEWAGGVLCNTRHPFAYRNMVVPLRKLAPQECAELRQLAVDFFAGLNRWVIHSAYPQPLHVDGLFRRIETTPIMWRAADKHLTLSPVPAFSVKEVESNAEMATFERIREVAHGRTWTGTAGGYFDARVLGGGLRCWLGVRDGVAVSTGSVFESDGIALIKNIATLPDCQGQGIGGLMSAHVVNQSSGIAMLDSTLNAQHLYAKLGFEVMGTMEFWKRT